MTESGIQSRARWRRLNLGCGMYPAADAVNVDLDPRSGADVLCDLDSFPYPFTEGGFEHISASHVLEHLRDPFTAVREWRRLLCAGGELVIKVPHFSRGFTHPDHKRGFDVSFPLFFNPAMTPWFGGTHLDLVSVRLRWNAQPYLKRFVASAPMYYAALAAGRCIDSVANLSPFLFSRLFTFWVGGFEEIEYRFRRPA